MKILVLNTDYADFLASLYAKHSGLETKSYDEQQKVRMNSLFGVADFYSSNLRNLGCEAVDVHANNENLQKAWAREHGLKIESGLEWSLGFRKYFIPWVSRHKSSRWMLRILAAQIQHYKPDVLLNQAMDCISSSFLAEMKPYIRLLVGQHAAPMPRDFDCSCYDLITSSLPNFCDYFRSHGIRSELCRLAFEPRILHELGERCPVIPVSFVGSLSSAHASRISLIETLCTETCIRIWGNGGNSLLPDLYLRRRLEKPVWGLEMYKILQSSQLTLNHHIGIAGEYANNMRLYEATGVGALLVTDWKKNLHELFEIGKEVVAYRSNEECLELIKYYADHTDEAAAIAYAGQQKTLRDHTYAKRMEEFVGIVRKLL